MISLSPEALAALCPMHAVLDRDGVITHVGPTLAKLADQDMVGHTAFDVFEFQGPRVARSMEALLGLAGRKLHLSLRGAAPQPLKGQVLPGAKGGALLSLGFGIGVVAAVHRYDLTSSDFAPTDLAVDMLYMLEAKSAAMDAARRLNVRLQGAMMAAEERAYTDTLTGLRNRRAVDSMLLRLCRAEARFAVLHVDLDHFKQVNDTLGHAAGDHVLQVLSEMMRDTIRRDDTVARVGGDEFVIIIENAVTLDRLNKLARSIIERASRPIVYAGRECRVGCSIGISLSDGRTTPDAIMEEADVALYAAKHAGRGQFCMFSESGVISNPHRQRAAGE